MKDTLRDRVHAWVAEFTEVPAGVLEKMARTDDDMYSYASPSFRLVASPTVRCDRCLYPHDGDASVLRPIESHGDLQIFVACENCGFDLGWIPQEPSVFPCAWSTLFAPPRFDRTWFLEHAAAVANLGFLVFESEDYGVLLGIDAAGFDFYEAYWMPLYTLRTSTPAEQSRCAA